MPKSNPLHPLMQDRLKPNRKLLIEYPSIVVAGLAWPIPPFAPRQLRFILPAMDRLQANSYDALVDIVFMALTRGHPDIDKDDFEDWPVSTTELREAVPVIMRQTGLRDDKKKPGPLSVKPEWPDWDAVIAEFCNFLPGTTPDYWEDALTVARMNAQYAAWKKYPPLPVVAAGYLKYKPDAEVQDDIEPMDASTVDRLLNMFPEGDIKIN